MRKALLKISRPDISLTEIYGALKEHPCNFLKIVSIIRDEEDILSALSPVQHYSFQHP